MDEDGLGLVECRREELDAIECQPIVVSSGAELVDNGVLDLGGRPDHILCLIEASIGTSRTCELNERLLPESLEWYDLIIGDFFEGGCGRDQYGVGGQRQGGAQAESSDEHGTDVVVVNQCRECLSNIMRLKLREEKKSLVSVA